MLNESLSKDEFERHKNALVSIKLQKDKALNDEVSRHWENAWNERYDFLIKEKEVKALLELDAGSFRKFFGQYLKPGAQMRRLSIHIFPAKTMAQGSISQGRDCNVITDMKAWKSTQEVYQPAAARCV